MRLLIATTAALALAAVVFAGVATPKNKVLKGTVGPSFTITLKNAVGKKVTSIKAGTYNLTVQDKASIHDFHLIGPGINKVITTVSFTGTKPVTVKLKVGRYIYQCDPHSFDMKGSFKVTA